ncbi:RNA polymerase sigma factor [Alicyclobacillus sendaiensis]|uniref:RNA polymerase sigma factor n=1 Tax=Alicyclobacillus sendaiensis TaxID=192387 RepID=UPI000AFF39BF|nr:sigma-70 family RNA polymerase sigma factor [Alicyclobacillus sendaiensis]
MADIQHEAKRAIQELLEHYGNEVYQYALYTLGDRGLAEDAVQEIFLRALQAWPRFEHRSSPRSWLWAIARHYVRDMIRKKRRAGNQAEVLLDHVADQPFDDRSLDRIELESTLQSLPVSYREVVILRVIQDRPVREIAELLGWPEVRVRVTLHRAIKKLRKDFVEADERRPNPRVGR